MHASTFFTGGALPCACRTPQTGAGRSRAAVVSVQAAKKSARKQQVVLVKDVPELGGRGALATVNPGYWRNYLQPQKLAKVATEGILANIRREEEARERKLLQVKAKAKAMAIALQTIGKFIIKKKVGEGDAIFGSVTTQEVVAAIEMQTGRLVDKRLVTLPEIKTTGTYDATVKLHPEVVGEFKVVVQREKGVSER